MFADGTVADGGPYDGIVTINSTESFQFTRPPSSNNYDTQRLAKHEIDEILGLGSYLGGPPSNSDFRPQDLFSWSAPGTRNHTVLGTRYFSIDNGATNIVGFNQDPTGDLGDWLSGLCPQSTPYVQNAFICKGQASDVTATSPEGINLDADRIRSHVGDSASGADDLGQHLHPVPWWKQATRYHWRFYRRGFPAEEGDLYGPSDTSLPLTGVLLNPFLELHDSSGAVIVSNDNWRSDQEQEIIATSFAPTNDNESAIVITLRFGSKWRSSAGQLAEAVLLSWRSMTSISSSIQS